MIIQNLHKKTLKREWNYRLIYLSLLLSFLFIIPTVQAQDSLVLEASISEKKLLEFESLFFDAITLKAIYKHQKAIEKLEECNALVPNEKAVLFELSKNYLLLKKIPEATTYANQSLAKDPENLWIQEHLVKIYRKSGRFNKAIEIQQKIGAKYPKKKQELVFLYLMDNNRTKARKLLDELSKAKLLNRRLRALKSSLDKRSSKKRTAAITTKNEGLESAFKKNKTFTNLSNLLQKLQKENSKELLVYSEEGLTLFPAQPFVYLMNGLALNNNKEFKKAITTLKNGIDFVIDDQKMEQRFYKELLRAYKGTGDNKNINKYQKKIK